MEHSNQNIQIMFWKSDDTIPLHNVVLQKEFILALLHVMYWYIRFQDELSVVLITTLDLESFIKGHHLYKDIWIPKQGEQLDVLMEPDNRMDKFAVCVKINEKTVGQMGKSSLKSARVT